jgi:polyisoprenoid-binding protein YceI
MPHLTRRTALFALTSFALQPAAAAAPVPYRLDQAASTVGFRFFLSGAEQTGSMPVDTATITVDPANLAASKVDVSLRVAGARTGLIFATQALIGPEVLDAAGFPTIRFVSDRVQLASDGRLSGGARIAGQLTLRGKTHPVSFDAGLFRPPGSAADDLSELRVKLTGQISRSAFGASGYPQLVADNVDLDITAVIRTIQ